MLQERPEYRPCTADVIGHAWVKEGEPITQDEVKAEMSQRSENIVLRSVDSEISITSAE